MNKEEFREKYWERFQESLRVGEASYMTYFEVSEFAALAWELLSDEVTHLTYSNAQYEKRIEELEKENVNLKSQLQDFNEELSKHAHESAKNLNELRRLGDEISHLKTVSSKYDNDLEFYMTKARLAESQRNDFKRLYEDVLFQMELKIRDYDVLQKSIGRHQQTIIEKDNRIARLEARVNALLETNEQLTKDDEERILELEEALTFYADVENISNHIACGDPDCMLMDEVTEVANKAFNK